MKTIYDKIYNDVEMKVGKLVTKDPSKMDKPEEIFEKASHIKLPKGVVVKLLKPKPNQIDIILPPDPKQVKKLQEEKNPLAEHFKSLFLNPNSNPEKDKMTLQQIVSGRAWVDPAFMKKLKKDPKEALAETLKKKLSKDLSVKLYEETTDKLYLMVPPAMAIGGELGEEELGSVAGGANYGALLGEHGEESSGTRINVVDSVNSAIVSAGHSTINATLKLGRTIKGLFD